MRTQVRPVLRDLATCVREHKLPIYASALAFQMLTALVPITLLGLAVLGATGLEDVWRDTLAPSVQEKVTPPVYEAIAFSVERLFSQGSAGLLAFASALLLWYLTFAVRYVMDALNTIHDVRERRSWRRQALTALGLAVVIACCITGAVLAIALGPRILDGGAVDWLLTIGRWPVAAGLLALQVALLFHYAPAERPDLGWASAGSILVIGVWLVTSILFRLWISHVANFETAVGSLTVFLILTAYVFVSSAIFLVGAELDELLRTKTRAKR